MTIKNTLICSNKNNNENITTLLCVFVSITNIHTNKCANTTPPAKSQTTQYVTCALALKHILGCALCLQEPWFKNKPYPLSAHSSASHKYLTQDAKSGL